MNAEKDNILERIQADLLDESVSLSTILREAKVLAYQLGSDELDNWASQELDGYESGDELPDYRILQPLGHIGTWTNGYDIVRNLQLPLALITDESVKELIANLPIEYGIRKVERLATDSEINCFVPPDIVRLINFCINQKGWGYADLQFAVSLHDFEQILDTVRNRLLDFVLKLGKTWHLGDEPPPEDKMISLVENLYKYNIQEGGNMTTFDQRGQQLSDQYNAARDININEVQDKNELANELEKLRQEVERAKELDAISQDAAVEAEYHLLQATKEAKKETPDKEGFSEHMEGAITALEGLTKAAGLVNAFLKVSEVARQIFI